MDVHTGLTSAEADEGLSRDGPNLVPEAKRSGLGRALLGQFTHLLAVLLWVAAAFALLAGLPQLAVAIVVIDGNDQVLSVAGYTSAWKRGRNILHHVNVERNLAHFALDAGYPDSTHFSHSLRRIYGLKPTALFSGSRRLQIINGRDVASDLTGLRA